MINDRLDILLYGHDGRGLGHVSRTVAIGMALRRLYPELKICVLTGCAQTNELIGPVSLEWIKLPSYQTEVTGGISKGIDGFCGFSDPALGKARSTMIRETVRLLRPRVILVDHAPQGKHRELLEMFEDCSEDHQPTMVLGIRGVVGAVAQTVSPVAQALFKSRFKSLLWYGDRQILGNSHPLELKRAFSTDPVECGYVSRLKELDQQNGPPPAESNKTLKSCLISVPWQGEYTGDYVQNLARAIAALGSSQVTFHLFMGESVDRALANLFDSIEGCQLYPFSSLYAQCLAESSSCIIFGGYNSLTDIIYFNIPSLVIVREMQDREQQIHLQSLRNHSDLITVQSEQQCSVEFLLEALKRLTGPPSPTRKSSTRININGAENSAHHLAGLIDR